MKVTIAYVSIVALVLLASYAALSIALDVYDSWVDYENKYLETIITKVERVTVHGEPLAKHVVFILLDGITVDVLIDLANRSEVVSKFVNSGAFYPNGLANMPTYSIPARASILTGAPPEINEVSSNYFNRKVRIDSLVRVAKQFNYTILCIGDSSFENLFRDLIDENISVGEGANHGAISLTSGYNLVKNRVEQGKKVFAWIGVADVDMIGHEAGAYSKEYNFTIINTVALTLEFIEKLSKEPLTKDTLVVVLSDHGFKRGGHHGGPEPEVKRVFLLLIGPVAKPGIYGIPFDHNDIAPTVSMIMGWSIPAISIGAPISNGLNIPLSRVDAYTRASQDQGLRVVRALSEATGISLDLRGNVKEVYRRLTAALERASIELRSALSIAVGATIVALSVALIVLGLGRGRIRNIKVKSVVAILVGLAAYELLFWALYKVNGGPFSLSDIYSFEDFISKILISSISTSLLIGLALGIVELTTLRRGFIRSLVMCSSIVALAALLGLIYPLIFHAEYGLFVRFPFPDWNSGVLFFLSLVKTSFTGLIGVPLTLAIVLLLSLLGFVIRRFSR